MSYCLIYLLCHFSQYDISSQYTVFNRFKCNVIYYWKSRMLTSVKSKVRRSFLLNIQTKFRRVLFWLFLKESKKQLEYSFINTFIIRNRCFIAKNMLHNRTNQLCLKYIIKITIIQASHWTPIHLLRISILCIPFFIKTKWINAILVYT